MVHRTAILNHTIVMKTLQQHNTIYTPYCYLIGWTKHNKFYYGVRYAKKYKCLYESGCHPDDFWVTYDTSSSYVDEYCSKYGNPDVMQIRKTFDTAKKAISWEERVLRRLNVQKKDMWLNKNVGGSFIWDKDSISKMSRAKTGVKHSKERKLNISKAMKGRKLTEEHKRKISKSHLGKKLCKEQRQQISTRQLQPVTIKSKLQDKEISFNSKTEMYRYLGVCSSFIPTLYKGWKIPRRSSKTKHPFMVGDIIYLLT